MSLISYTTPIVSNKSNFPQSQGATQYSEKIYNLLKSHVPNIKKEICDALSEKLSSGILLGKKKFQSVSNINETPFNEKKHNWLLAYYYCLDNDIDNLKAIYNKYNKYNPLKSVITFNDTVFYAIMIYKNIVSSTFFRSKSFFRLYVSCQCYKLKDIEDKLTEHLKKYDTDSAEAYDKINSYHKRNQRTCNYL